MIKQILASAFVLALACPAIAQPAEPGGNVPAFFVAPITTEVHREVVAADAAAYAVVDCTSLVVDGESDLNRLNPAEFERQLAAIAAANPAGLRLVCRYRLSGEPEITQETKAAIQSALLKIAEAAGFRDVRATEMSTSAAWSEAYDRVAAFEEAPGAEELMVHGTLVKAYALRTRLSRLVEGEGDCMIEIKRPFDGREQEISPALRAEIAQAVELLHLGDQKQKLLFRVLTTPAGERFVQQAFYNTRRVPPNMPAELQAAMKEALAQQPANEGLQLALDLGFADMSTAHVPTSGAPEKLVGQPAPNFELPTLVGESLDFDAFRKGRPALVTFWGVACGPCCVEAPHLTALHAERGGEFAILAVNAYDESAEVVAKFVEKTKLTHPMVLDGGDVAREQYQVGAYPTTFWINRDGTVADYDIGFDAPADIERRVAALLGE
jgi:thiol-disulfide isomerase/thioredoxin